MGYFEAYRQLKNIVNFTDKKIDIGDDFVLINDEFFSKHKSLLPGGDDEHAEEEIIDNAIYQQTACAKLLLAKKDAAIDENLHFRFHTILPANEKRSNKCIFFLHGFNEKSWSKYLPWAKRLAESTGKAIILFPIAFHMNRARQEWSDMRIMYPICEQRKSVYPDIIHSTVSNVAISTRLHYKPQRFIWSGLQTYYDIIDFIEDIKANSIAYIDKDATIDFFAYSIGCMIAEILMMTNQHDYFSNSKLCMFCGGAVFNRLSPVSKFILDSKANVSLYSYLVEHLPAHLTHDDKLHEYLSNPHKEGIFFRSMLDYKIFMPQREEALRTMQNRVLAISLQKDMVIPFYEIQNTLKGSRRDIQIPIEIMDYSYPYRHEEPFPVKQGMANEVNKAFDETFAVIGNYLQ